MNKQEKINQARSFGMSDEMESTTYNLTIGAFLLYGLFATYLLSTQTINFLRLINGNTYILMIGYFVSAITGSVVMGKAKTTLVRFLGYNLVVVPLGLLVGIASLLVDGFVVIQAIGATASVVVMMTALAVIRPQFFLKLGGILGISLFAAIIAQGVMMLVSGSIPTFMDWAIVVLFAGFVGYDWSIAQMYPKTVANAVLASASIYLDVINIFLRLLNIMGRKD